MESSKLPMEFPAGVAIYQAGNAHPFPRAGPSQSTVSPAPAPGAAYAVGAGGPLPIFDLPFELQSMVVHGLIPTGHIITIMPYGVKMIDDEFEYVSCVPKGWFAWETSAGEDEDYQYDTYVFDPIDADVWTPDMICPPWFCLEEDEDENGQKPRRFVLDAGQRELLVSNTAISEYARKLLYGENTFVFTIDTDHKYYDNELHLGPLGPSCGKRSLQHLRNVKLVIGRSTHDPVAYKWTTANDPAAYQWLQKRMKSFIRNLRSFTTIDTGSSRVAKVHIIIEDLNSYDEDREEMLFTLEALAGFRGFAFRNTTFRIDGPSLPEWYLEALKLWLKDRDNSLHKVDYSKSPEKRLMEYWPGEGKWAEPKFDWEEYTKRNGIDGFDEWKSERTQ